MCMHVSMPMHICVSMRMHVSMRICIYVSRHVCMYLSVMCSCVCECVLCLCALRRQARADERVRPVVKQLAEAGGGARAPRLLAIQCIQRLV